MVLKSVKKVLKIFVTKRVETLLNTQHQQSTTTVHSTLNK